LLIFVLTSSLPNFLVDNHRFLSLIACPFLIMIRILVLVATFIWVAKEIKGVKDVLIKLRLTVLRLATESPRVVEDQANSIIGLEADVCAIRSTVKKLESDIQIIKEAFA
jgi:hypothetical protein